MSRDKPEEKGGESPPLLHETFQSLAIQTAYQTVQRYIVDILAVGSRERQSVLRSARKRSPKGTEEQKGKEKKRRNIRRNINEEEQERAYLGKHTQLKRTYPRNCLVFVQVCTI
jgi:hypothetical protein